MNTKVVLSIQIEIPHLFQRAMSEKYKTFVQKTLFLMTDFHYWQRHAHGLYDLNRTVSPTNEPLQTSKQPHFECADTFCHSQAEVHERKLHLGSSHEMDSALPSTRSLKENSALCEPDDATILYVPLSSSTGCHKTKTLSYLDKTEERKVKYRSYVVSTK